MPRYGAQYGPDITFLGVDRCDLEDAASFADADVVVLVVLEALSAIARRRLDARDGIAWDPTLPLLADRPTPEDLT
jgi:hypothetical protein